MSSAPYKPNTPALDDFQWTVQPLAERMVQDILDAAVARSPFAGELKRRMRDETGTRLFDWLDQPVQRVTGAIAAAGTPVTVNAIEPTDHQFNIAAVEILARVEPGAGEAGVVRGVGERVRIRLGNLSVGHYVSALRASMIRNRIDSATCWHCRNSSIPAFVIWPSLM